MTKKRPKTPKPEKTVPAVVIGKVLEVLKDAAMTCSKLTDSMNKVRWILGQLDVDGDGNLIGWNSDQETKRK